MTIELTTYELSLIETKTQEEVSKWMETQPEITPETPPTVLETADFKTVPSVLNIISHNMPLYEARSDGTVQEWVFLSTWVSQRIVQVGTDDNMAVALTTSVLDRLYFSRKDATIAHLLKTGTGSFVSPEQIERYTLITRKRLIQAEKNIKLQRLAAESLRVKAEKDRKAAEKKAKDEAEAQQFALSRKALLVYFHNKDAALIRKTLFISTSHEKYTNPRYDIYSDTKALSDLTVAEMGEVKKIYELLEGKN